MHDIHIHMLTELSCLFRLVVYFEVVLFSNKEHI